jgi:uncharacterized protein YbaP (TraB family)
LLALIRRRVVAAALLGVVLSSAVLSGHGTNNGRGFIWRIERDGRIGWLVGSIHVLTPDYYPLPDAMQKAFLRAVTLLEEADVSEVSAPDVMELVRTKAIYSNGESLKTELSPETYQMTADRLQKMGLSIEVFERMKPWMITLTLMAAEMKRSGFDPALGVDRHFFEKSAKMGKKFQTLETAAEQLGIFAGLPPKIQEAMLRDTVKGLEAEISQMSTVAEAWRAGDAAVLERVVLQPIMREPALYDAIIVNRNRNWVPKIESCLEEGHCFVVVGAAHLLGPDGLVMVLKQKGYSVFQE